MKRLYLVLLLSFLLATDLFASSTLYYLPTCPYSQKVLSYLKKYPDESISMKDLSNNPEGKEELIKTGGEARVPCLVIDNQAIYGATAIIELLMKEDDIKSEIDYKIK